MTGQEWESCTDPQAMLAFLGGRAADRKLRLLMAAACRRLLHLLDEPQYLALVEAGERVADGALSPASLARYRTSCPPISASDLVLEERRWHEHSQDFNGPVLAKRAVWLSGSRDRHRVEECLHHAARGLRARHAIRDEQAHQCRLIRDIFGNPFRPLPAIAPSLLAWNGGTVPKLAQAIYEGRAFDRLPVLADALEEAGCDDTDLLGHLRGPGPHTRGCHALDALLGKPYRTAVLTEGLRQARYWVIARDAEATGRHVRQTSCPAHYAVVTLRLEIDFGPDAVVFENRLDEDTRSPGTDGAPFVSEVMEGVKEALASLSPDGGPIQGVKVSLVGMSVHPVDSQGRDFRRAAILAVTEAVREAGLVEGPS